MGVPELARLSMVSRKLWQSYGTPAKEANALRLQELARSCAERVDAWPWRVILDPVSICNLRCTDCGSHTGNLPRLVLEPANVERFLADLWPHLVQVNLFHWGEPFLNPQIDRIVAAIHQRGIGTQIHSNMNRMPEGMPQRIVEAGLDFLIASIDGVTQATYEIYRKGGQVERAIANLKQVVEARRRLGSSTPRIVWRFLCFPHTMAEMERARQMAGEIGVDDFALGEGALDGQVWTASGPRPLSSGGCNVRPETMFPLCEDLYDFPAIHQDGKLLPCCYVSQMQYAYGDLASQPWMEAFNTEAFRRARRLAAGKGAASPCATCFKLAALKGTAVA